MNYKNLARIDENTITVNMDYLYKYISKQNLNIDEIVNCFFKINDKILIE